MHLGLAAQALDVGQEVALVGADRAAQRVVILERGAEAERKNGGLVKAAGDHAGVVASGGLRLGAGQAAGVFGQVLGDDNGEIGGWKEEDLIPKESGYLGQWHRAAMTG